MYESTQGVEQRSIVQIIGGLAQLGEHLLCKQGVNGSIPLASTINYREGKLMVVVRVARLKFLAKANDLSLAS